VYLIFFTGAVVLSLEVLSSRIMTPYFGVSLYIWAGILSITLTFLAVGYYLGGRLSERLGRAVQALIFLAMPVMAAAAALVACLIYPFAFPAMARVDLVFGSFTASAVLLAVPLVCLSAMNPILISLRAGIKQGAEHHGDGGAGLVLFVSTAGSVAGVLVTAFVLIPSFTNFEAVLWLGVVLCGLSLIAALRAADLDRRGLVMAGAVGVSVLCGALIGAQDRFFKLLAAVDAANLQVDVVAEYTSVFGNIKIANVTPRDANRDAAPQPIKVYVQDGLIQNRATSDNVSVSMYTYVLDRLAGAFVPEAKTAVVLGLGAGYVPRFMRDRGIKVSAVEINPLSLTVARDHFGFDAAGIDLSITDARTYARDCRAAFDVAIVDLFQGDATPDYLLSAEFFTDLRRCLKPGGGVVMNAFLDDDNPGPNFRLLATIASAFPNVLKFQVGKGNAFLVGLTGPVPASVDYDLERIPAALLAEVAPTLESGRHVPAGALLGYAPVSDRQNRFSTLMAEARMAHRQWLARELPARLLMN